MLRPLRLPVGLVPAVLLAIAVLAIAPLAGCASADSATITTTKAAASSSDATAGATGAPTTDTTAAPGGRAAAPEVATVELIMDWVPWVLDIPIDVAQVKGYYKDRGLTVTQTVPAGATDVVKFVGAGRSQFGLYYAPDTLMGVAEGAPLLSVGSLMPHAPVGMAFKPGLQATTPKDLEGKIAAVPLIPSVRASFDAMLAAGGVDAAKVTVVDPGFDLVAPVLVGKYDAGAFTEFGELVEAQAQGQQLTFMDFRKWGTPDYAFLNVVTNREFAAKNPATVRAFVQATFAGLAYALANPEEAVDLYVQRHPELKKDLLLSQWKAAMPSMAVPADGRPAGWQDPAAWTTLDQWMVTAKLLQAPVDVTTALSNDFLGGTE
jgi:NitT/TauT family transport system substrate-binding protein